MSSLESLKVVSGFPISVGTSLALESVFKRIQESLEPEKTVSIDVKKYDELWFNIFTLFRNLYGSIERSSVNDFDAQDFYDSLFLEMEFISYLCFQNNKTCVFYYSDYSDLENKTSRAVLRVYNTDLQKEYGDLYLKTINKIKNNKNLLQKFNIQHYKNFITPINMKRVLILTHIPFDLLKHIRFTKLSLLESHTGKLKDLPDWHTKFLDGKNIPMIPFLHVFLKIFGDKETYRPMDIKFRKKIIEIAEKKNWNFNTSLNKVKNDIETLMLDLNYLATFRSLL